MRKVSPTMVKWEIIPYDFKQCWDKLVSVCKKHREEYPLLLGSSALMATVSISGCSGLEAYLQYNESKVAGCFVVPIYGADVTPEESAPKQIECPKPIKVIPVPP